jgi:uncharacterized membrane protein
MPVQVNNKRYQILDFTRGLAIGLMFIYHLSFGLAQLGYFTIHFSTDFFWISFRALIVFLFLALVGIGLFLATRNKLNVRAYFKRLLLLLVYFLLITLLSQSVRPDFYVFFGILHLIFVSSILGLLFVKLYWTNLIIGLLVIGCGNFIHITRLDHPMLQWVGMNNINPIADDYAPLLPWFGLVLIGIFLGQMLFSKYQFKSLYDWQAEHWITRLISWAGRHSIHLYFVHFQLFYVLVYFFS